MRIFTSFFALALLIVNVIALPMPYTSDDDMFSQEMSSVYNLYRAENGMPPANPLECANRLANSINWVSYADIASEIVTDQYDITIKGREACPDLPNASFFLAVIQSSNTGLFNRINELTPNGIASWSHFGSGRYKFRDSFMWSLVLVDPSGNNGGSSAQIAAQSTQTSWDQAASNLYDIWGSHGGI
jgi:hypothetical protein